MYKPYIYVDEAYPICPRVVPNGRESFNSFQTILMDIDGVLLPDRFTLLLGTPGSQLTAAKVSGWQASQDSFAGEHQGGCC